MIEILLFAAQIYGIDCSEQAKRLSYGNQCLMTVERVFTTPCYGSEAGVVQTLGDYIIKPHHTVYLRDRIEFTQLPEKRNKEKREKKK